MGIIIKPLVTEKLTVLGENNSVPFERAFAKFGIVDRFVRVPGSTRRNEMVVTPEGNFKTNQCCHLISRIANCAKLDLIDFKPATNVLRFRDMGGSEDE